MVAFQELAVKKFVSYAPLFHNNFELYRNVFLAFLKNPAIFSLLTYGFLSIPCEIHLYVFCDRSQLSCSQELSIPFIWIVGIFFLLTVTCISSIVEEK